MKHVAVSARCELMDRLRSPAEIRGRRLRYYLAPIRLCTAAAVALVKFAGDDKPRRICDRHLDLELTDRIGYTVDRGALEAIACPSRELEIEWFEPIHVSQGKKPPREYSPAVALAETKLYNRAPEERSWDTPDTRERRRAAGDRMS